MRKVFFAALLLFVSLFSYSEDIIFEPIYTGGENSEEHTCLWLRSDLGDASEILPLKTRQWATKDSVTGGAAIKFTFEQGSMGIAATESKPLKKGSAGLTFYAKASEAVNLKVCDLTEVALSTEWKKYDIPWEKLGTTSEDPKFPWQLKFALPYPVQKRTILWLDRIGVESPVFDKAPKIAPETGEDEKISSKELIYGAENMADVIKNLKEKKPFKVIAFGDSVTAGAQRFRSTWALAKHKKTFDYLYFSHLATLMKEEFDYKGVKYLQFGHGGWSTRQGIKVANDEVVKEAGPDDLVIIEFGANDLMGRSNMENVKDDIRELLGMVKTKTKNIIVMGLPYGIGTEKFYEEQTEALKEFVKEDKVAAFDLSKLSFYRGRKFGFSLYANMYHPDYMGHISIAEMMIPMFTGKHTIYPEKE